MYTCTCSMSLRASTNQFKMDIIESRLDRKLIKSLFMPLIYGKTLISMEKDRRDK
uniref:Uncharacterized protein n=1 Tax=Utricularia reniformis TaxID=192314 RepID=A0A1Y0B1Y3_9LAMI|nr:hypothetical protein AEK19_MT1155 [Utricularia reniformis]ART31369.1 hypothetical protein AEK19_MT1155 [Utricularia reniformis]